MSNQAKFQQDSVIGVIYTPKSRDVARAFPDERAAHREDQYDEKNEDQHWGKIWETVGKWGKIEEMLLSCPPELRV